MKNITQHTGTLNIVRRLESSYFGNPRYLVEVDGVQFKTGVDSMFGYSITNFEGKPVKVTIGTHYNNLTLNSIEGA
jgi:hypothetical protein